MLDLKTEPGRATLVRLVEQADALVENFRAGVMDGLGLGYETLAACNPRLVYLAIRGFGDPRTGESPYLDWPAFDVVAQAMSGVVSFTGTADGRTVRVGPSVGDLYPATVAALGLTASLLDARRTGRGQFVDVAMYDALTALSEAIVYRYSYNGSVTRPTGNSHPQLTPFDMYPTADGSCAIAAPTAKHWEILCEVMGRPDLVSDERTDGGQGHLPPRATLRVAIDGGSRLARDAVAVGERLGDLGDGLRLVRRSLDQLVLEGLVHVAGEVAEERARRPRPERTLVLGPGGRRRQQRQRRRERQSALRTGTHRAPSCLSVHVSPRSGWRAPPRRGRRSPRP